MQPQLLSLPSCLHRSTAFLILALAIFMVAVQTAIATIAAQRTSLSPKTKTIVPFVVATFFASWLAIAIVVGDELISPYLWNRAEQSVDWWR